VSDTALSLRARSRVLPRLHVQVDPWVVGTLAVAAFAFAIRVAAAGQQSAYMDEGTNVITGRMLVEQHAVYAEVLNWAYGSYLWPLIAGVADEIGGLQLVRGVTAACGALMVLATALLAARLAPPSMSRERRWTVALLAGGAMAIAPTAIAVGRFGTYDALAGAGFMLGVALLSAREIPRTHMLVAAALLFVAFLAKYLVAIYFPVVCIYLMARHGWRPRSAIHDAVWFVMPLTVACVAYALIFVGPLLTLFTSSLRYGDLKSSDPLHEYVWTRPDLWLLALLALWAGRKAPWRSRLIAASGVAIIMVFQVVARPDFDFWKHSIYVIFFLAPLAALSCSPVELRTGTKRVVSVLLAGVFGFVAWGPAVSAANDLIGFYPNLNPSMATIQQTLANSAVVLTDDTALRYYEYPAMGTDRLIGPFSFAYQSQTDLEAYRRAVADRFFDTIVLDGGVTPQGNAIRAQLSQTIQSTYQRVYSQQDGIFDIEVYKPIRPAGSSTADDTQAAWPDAHTFDAGVGGWGAHPESGDWQSGRQIVVAATPSWNDHPSLQFTPAPDASIVSMRQNEHVSRMRARVYLIPAAGVTTPIRVGFVGFDANWQWHDDGFRWVVPANSWTTISWNLTTPQTFNEVGLQVPSGVTQAYIGSFETAP
jgi:hypothetical protein